MKPRILLSTVLALFVGHPVVDAASLERLERPDGSTVDGRLVGSAAKGFRFIPSGNSDAFELDRSGSVRFEPDSLAAKAGATPPFQILLGRDQRISGRLEVCDQDTIRLADGPDGKPVVIKRTGALAIVQRAGEILVLDEGFEKLDAGRWTMTGSPEISDKFKTAGTSALFLPAGSASVTSRLLDAVGRGRLELAFRDDGRIVAREHSVVELVFRGDRGDESIKAVLGWAEESLAVESPGGPALAVQRLVRKPGWRRLGVRFGPERTEVSIDGYELAHGKGPGGSLYEIRLSTQSSSNASAPKDLGVAFDDLRVVRFSQPSGEMESDPSQDEVRMVSGDQSFGEATRVDAAGIRLHVEGRDISYPWSEVSGLFLKRLSQPSRPVSGLLVRVEWLSAPGNDARDIDAVEGALIDASSDHLVVETPNAGTLRLPRDRMKHLSVVGNATLIVIDPYSHHLGDDVSEAPEHLDPPQPEGPTLERTFDLSAPPPTGARFVIDAVQVVGEAPGLRYSNKIRDGELVTNVFVNEKKIDYLNRYITTNNETPEVVRIPIPPGLLKQGKNTVRFEQVGLKNDPGYLDDLGILGIAIELDGPTGPGRSKD